MGIEDALVLSELLSDGRVWSSADLPAVFAVYDTMRRPRTQKLVRHSRDAALLYQFRKPGCESSVDKIRTELDGMQGWIWDFDLERHLSDARSALETLMEEERSFTKEAPARRSRTCKPELCVIL